MAAKRRSSKPVKPAQRQKEHSQVFYETLGIGLIALALVLLIGLLCGTRAGGVGKTLTSVLALGFGAGAFGIPVALIVLGIWTMGRFSQIRSRNNLIGVLLIFLCSLCWYHLIRTKPGQELFDIPLRWLQLTNQEGNPFWWDGGILGALMALVLRKALGIASFVPLAAGNLVGVLLIANTSLAQVNGRLKDEWDGLRSPSDPAENKPDTNKEEKGILSFLERKPKEPETKKPVLPEPTAKSQPILTPQPVSNPVAVVEKALKRKPIVHKETEQMELDVETPEGEYILPPASLLDPPGEPPKRSREELETKIKTIEQTLDQFNIQANVVEIAHGPTVTRYEIQLAPGIRVKKIVSLADNLAMSLAAIDVRLEAPIPGKSAIGVEVPNQYRAIVSLRECVEAEEFKKGSKITFVLGKDVANQVQTADLVKMPHLLIGGATNSGKSICLNTLIASILYRATPDEVKFILIDPKRVELTLFDGIPHLIHPVVKDVRQAAGILRWALKEMERRYDLFSRNLVRNIDGFNEKLPPDEKPMPYIVIVIDELADLMMQQGPEVETCICRLAQLARATGIHLVIATQRPSVDIITGTIKANISSRIAFAVSSGVDSRTILDATGAERLIGRGDMLFHPIDASKPIRVQGAFLSEKEIERLVKYLKGQSKPEYIAEALSVDNDAFDGKTGPGDSGNAEDEYFEPAVRLVVTSGHASTSSLQRKFKIGYTRAARLVDMMEERGIVGPLDGSKPREILINRMQLDSLFFAGGEDHSIAVNDRALIHRDEYSDDDHSFDGDDGN